MTHYRSRRTLALSSVAAAALALASCTNSDTEPTASATSITVESTASAVAPAPLAATADGTRTDAPTAQEGQRGDASADAALTITDMRIGHHDGFDRVVYQFDGTGTPGWRTEVVGTVVQQGSGNPIAVAGQGILQVLIDGSAMPFTTGVEPYAGPNPLEIEKPGIVTEVRDAGVFEGTAQTLIGLTTRGVSYRVYTLEGPTRLVVDVAR
ncbi:AMIN-like domain-containing (lipo)protein [Prescottella subtropica]|uniref:AMIN-like domain-containing (lipo)protein n=1 Tax=Prescottella subtropica TaxID=2545757 RepID=UPI0010F5864A|nr:hypothetical protein [Prescottella subtropica]